MFSDQEVQLGICTRVSTDSTDSTEVIVSTSVYNPKGPEENKMDKGSTLRDNSRGIQASYFPAKCIKWVQGQSRIGTPLTSTPLRTCCIPQCHSAPQSACSSPAAPAAGVDGSTDQGGPVSALPPPPRMALTCLSPWSDCLFFF